MVEMLGVLAVIGVLSIGGIMGYSYGMDKYLTNETINDVNLRMIDIITHISQWREILEISSEFEDTGPVTTSSAGYIGTFGRAYDNNGVRALCHD